MSRTTRQRWLSSARSLLNRSLTKRRGTRDVSPLARLLRIEPLEDRRPLAITVNTLVDEADGSIVDGDISLRDAISASPAGGVINFSVNGTINLALGEVVVQDRIIQGPGAGLLTIDAHGASRVFRTRGTTTLSGLTITGGRGVGFGGGGIYNEYVGSGSSLTVVDSIVTGNTAGIDFGGGNIFGAAGGGIHAGGDVLAYNSLKVVDSTIANNTALWDGVSGDFSNGDGGGIFSGFSDVIVDRSTISGNTAGRTGGGLWGVATLTNSTVSGNSAGFVDGGGGVFGSSMVANSTISGNRFGGIVTSGVVADSTIVGNNLGFGVTGGATLLNSILAGNFGDPPSVPGGDLGTINTGASRNNLIADAATAGGLVDGLNGNIVGVVDPGLGPLADNGGPTKTYALYSFSPAVDAGDNSLVPLDPSTGLPFTVDQTGASRIFGGGTVDMGAVEHQGTPIPSTIVNTATDDVTGNALTSLREAISFAQQLGGPVTFDSTVFATPQTIPLVHGQIIVDGTSAPLTISGPGAGLATVDAGGTSRIFKTYGTTTISGLTITGGGGHAFDDAGAVYNVFLGTLTLSDCAVSGNTASGINNFGTLAVIDSIISGNQGLRGAGILNYDVALNPVATITNSIIEGNTATGGGSYGGGGIFCNGTVTITNSTISGNSAQNGGGIRQFGGTSSIVGTYIHNNSAVANGGGLWHFIGSMSVSASTISENSAGSGGGIFAHDFTVINSTISGNSAVFGGGIWGGFNSVIRNSTIAKNTASGQGGGIYYQGPTIVNSIIAGNTKGATPNDVVGVNVLNTASAYNLIGDAATAGGLTNGAGGNIVGVDPALVFGPLTGNGGPTPTHALLNGSPAIDAGDPTADAGVGNIPQYDQRDFPFSRVIDGNGTGPARIDMGGFEVHTLPPATPALFGDYNQNGVVDAADYVLWRDTLGTTNLAAFSGADGDGNGLIGQGDYNVWRAHFGQSLPPAAAGASNTAGQNLTAAPSGAAAASATSEVAMAVPTTANEGSDLALNVAKPAVRSEFVWFADANRSPRVSALQGATTSGIAESLSHENALLAWLSSSRFQELPLAENIVSSPYSTEDDTNADGSESNSVDKVFAGLGIASLIDFQS